ncbi:N-lysine methyltransferase SMYD2-A isoform X2 [Neoarius graeffei]|uniref:N-lysine methyltransferase SMYD2-A isoform X2 n=1 Tax=Neoarius graeffei TaxID=443677 RepID=UPI00298C273E|nr:N-lysine methyltransferase SMYD2-A isoform X2 [Neoarius graeffei]
MAACLQNLYTLSHIFSINDAFPDVQATHFICTNAPSYHHRCWLLNCALMIRRMAPLLFSLEDGVVVSTVASQQEGPGFEPSGRRGLACSPCVCVGFLWVLWFPPQFKNMQVNCNGFTIEDEELSHLGSAVFPDVALMNHSCNPNVIVTYKGTVAEVHAVQKISPGEEIFNSYIDLLYSTEDRNERLKDSYFFTCDCTECITKSKDKAKMEIHQKLSNPPEPEEIQEMVRYAKNIIEEFRRAKHYKTPSELLEICELSLEKMGSIFVDTNVYMLHMMYQAMGVCLYMQDWDGAMKYGEKIVQPYSVYYPQYSLNVASMYLKLGRLYLGLEKKPQGVKALKKAIAIMNVAFGKDHHYITEIKKEMEAHK